MVGVMRPKKRMKSRHRGGYFGGMDEDEVASPIIFAKIPDGHEDFQFKDQVSFLRIFPLEIWILILSCVKSSKDLENLCNSSLYLRHLLFQQRVTFLFPQVWNLLAVKFEKQHDSSDRSHSQQISRKEVLNLRLVFRTWMEGVDAYYQDPLHRQTMEPEIKTCTCTQKHWTHNEFHKFQSTGHSVNDFLQHFEMTHVGGVDDNIRNPFINRAIQIEAVPPVRGRGRNAEFLQSRLDNLLRLAAIYGHHIWHCKIIANRGANGKMVHFYSQLRNLLESMPNLKSLTVLHSEGIKTRHLESQLKALRSKMAVNPLPDLKDLQYLRISGLVTPIFQNLISSAGSLLMLRIIPPVNNDYDVTSILNRSLTKLSITFNTEAEYHKLLEGPHQVWLLRTLVLDLTKISELPWYRIFGFISKKWKDTLNRLVLELPKDRTLEGVKGKKELVLNRIRTLKITMPGYYNFDFMLPLKTLETLDIKIDAPKDSDSEISSDSDSEPLGEDMEQDQIIKFWYTLRQQLKTNVWKFFPKLKRVKFWDLNSDKENCSLLRGKWEKSI